MRQFLRIAVVLGLMTLHGCATFSARGAVEVSRAQLLKLSHNDTTDCLYYKGSDASYHYIFHNEVFRKTTGSDGSYKIPVEDLPLKETFAVGKGSYPLFTTAILEATATPANSPETTNSATADESDTRG